MIALVLGYVMFRLSNTPTISDVDEVIDSINKLAETITTSIVSNSSRVETTEKAADDLKTLYTDLLVKTNKNETDIGNNSTLDGTLKRTVDANTGNIQTIQDELSLITDYVSTNQLDDTIENTLLSIGAAMDSILNFKNSEYLQADGEDLKFCLGEDDCKKLAFQ